MPNNELRAVRDQLEALLKSGSKDALFNYFTPSIDTEKTQFKALQVWCFEGWV